MSARGIEAVVVEGERVKACETCGTALRQYRIEITSGPAKGVRLWANPVHPCTPKRGAQ